MVQKSLGIYEKCLEEQGFAANCEVGSTDLSVRSRYSACSVRRNSPTAAGYGAAAPCARARLRMDSRLPAMGWATLYVGKRQMGDAAASHGIMGSGALASESSRVVLGTRPLASLD